MVLDRMKLLLDEDSKRESVLLPLNEYQDLMDDLVDLAKIAGRKDEPSVSLDAVKKRLEGKWQSTGSK